jgi:hypothetical protein
MACVLLRRQFDAKMVVGWMPTKAQSSRWLGHLMRRTLHPKIKGELWTFECKDCGKQTEKSKLN